MRTFLELQRVTTELAHSLGRNKGITIQLREDLYYEALTGFIEHNKLTGRVQLDAVDFEINDVKIQLDLQS